jgi:hypothetical protein
MKGKKFTLAVAAGAIGLLGLTGAGVAFADGNVPAIPGQVAHLGRGPHGGAGAMGSQGPSATGGQAGVYHDQMHEAAAKALGITVSDLQTQLDAGKTVAQIAQERGVDLTTVQAAMKDAHPGGMGAGGMGPGAGPGNGAGACPYAS